MSFMTMVNWEQSKHKKFIFFFFICNMSSFLTKKHKPALAVVNVEIALVDMKTAKVEVEAQIQI